MTQFVEDLGALKNSPSACFLDSANSARSSEGNLATVEKTKLDENSENFYNIH